MAESGQGITEWTDQLARARTPAEFQAVTEAVLGDGRSALGALHQFLESAAEWCDRNQEPGLARRYRSSANHLAQLGDQLAYLGEEHLARTYAPLRAPRTQQSPIPPPPPGHRPGPGISRHL